MIVLDSHLWFWWISQEHQRFPSHWQSLIEEAERIGVSAVSCYELAWARRRDRLQMPCETGVWFREALEPAGIELLAVTPDIASRAADLSDIHRDPFDRIIMATALELEARLASLDGNFARYAELEDVLLSKEPS